MRVLGPARSVSRHDTASVAERVDDPSGGRYHRAASERDRQTKAGIQPIDFGPAEAKKFIEKANEVAWQSVIKRAPETGERSNGWSGLHPVCDHPPAWPEQA